jgi:hypothetical protein
VSADLVALAEGESLEVDTPRLGGGHVVVCMVFSSRRLHRKPQRQLGFSSFGAPGISTVLRVQVPPNEVILIKANRNCRRATDCGKEAGSEAVGR